MKYRMMWESLKETAQFMAESEEELEIHSVLREKDNYCEGVRK